MKLVLAEHDNNKLNPAILNVIGAASRLPGELCVLVTGYQCSAVVEQATILEHVNRVYVADAEHYQHQLAEELAPLIVNLVKPGDYLLAPASTYGKNLLPRVAAMLGVGVVSDIISIEAADTFVRLIYAGNAAATVLTTDPIKIVSIRTSAFIACELSTEKAVIEKIDPVQKQGLSSFKSASLSQSQRPDLATARVVVSGGRGFGTTENFQLLEQLADRLDAAIGASRAAVDSGFISNDYQVGQTGKIVAPELYIALGISGAIQHLAGMKDSKLIVAVNIDADAPIFRVADFALVMDLFEFIPEFLECLDKV